MSKRVIMRIEMTPGSRERLDAFCRRTGMTKVAATSRLVDWFCRQPDTMQAIIQRLYPASIEADAARIILKKMASRKYTAATTSKGSAM